MSLRDGEADRLRSTRAWAHPLRLRIMSLLTGAELSAAEVARELGVTQANASYHLRRLAEAGELEVGTTEVVRGGVAKKYRYVAREAGAPKASTGMVPDVGRMQQLRESVDAELRRRILLAAEGPRQFTDAEVWLSPQDLAEAHRLLGEVSRLVHERALPPRAEGARHVSFVAWVFTMSEGKDGHAES